MFGSRYVWIYSCLCEALRVNPETRRSTKIRIKLTMEICKGEDEIKLCIILYTHFPDEASKRRKLGDKIVVGTIHKHYFSLRILYNYNQQQHTRTHT